MNWFCPSCERSYQETRPEHCSCGGPVVTDFRGEVLADRYRVVSLQGTGSQDSTVWIARQLSVDRDVAVKLMPIRKDVARQRFARGARLASVLNHPHITTVHDYGESGDSYVYMVMELLAGRTLREEVQGGQALALERCLHIACQVLRALEEAHSHQIVHRDLKPDNLFLSPRLGDDDYIKVLDFGIAKLFERPAKADEDTGTTMDGQVTRGWQLCGTPLYMAPEQISGEAVDGRTDIYALGVVLYQMLTGRVPFRAKTQYAVLSQHLRDPPPAMGEINSDLSIPAEVESIVVRAMSKDAAQRFGSAKEMRRAIQAAQASLGLRIDATADPDDDLPRRSPTVDEAPIGLDLPAPPTSSASSASSASSGSSGSDRTRPRFGSFAVTVVAVAGLSLGAWGLGQLMGDSDLADVDDGGETSEVQSQRSSPSRVTDEPKKLVRPSLRPRIEPATGVGGPASTTDLDLKKGEARGLPISLDLRTKPSGAVVRNGEKELGRTPMTVSLRADRSHRLDVVLKGYESHNVVVDPEQYDNPDSGLHLEFDVTLVKVSAGARPSAGSSTPTPRRSSRPKKARKATPTVAPRPRVKSVDTGEVDDTEPALKLPGNTPRIEVLE